MSLPQDLARDVAQALRTFRRRPGFTFLIVAVLALGIGATTAVFDLTNLLAWREMPVHEPDQLTRVFTNRQRGFAGPYHPTSYPDYSDYRDQNRSFEGLAAHVYRSLRLEAGSTPQDITAEVVSGNFFQVMGLPLGLGRPLDMADDKPDSEPVVVLGHRLWQRMGGDPAIVGQRLKLGAVEVTVVGVVSAAFTGTMTGNRTDLLLPLAALPRALESDPTQFFEDRSVRQVYMTGRLRAGSNRSNAQAELATLAQQLDSAHPLPGSFTRKITLTPAKLTHPVDLVRMVPTLRLFAISAFLLLTITCANVAHLLLATATARRREIGIRQSLGAKRGRLVRQLLAENLLLALIGGTGGVLLARWARTFISSFASPEFAGDMRFDARVLGGTFAACLIATLLFGLAPALATARVDLVRALKSGPEGSAGLRFSAGRWLSAGRLLSIAQVALSVILLSAGALLTQSLWQRANAERGFDDENLIMARMSLPEKGYTQESGQAFINQAVQRVRELPAVQQAGLCMLVPPVLLDISVPVSLPEAPEQQHKVRVNFVDSGYFHTLGIPLEQGRLFDHRDTLNSQPVVIVNHRLAEQLWPGEEVLGRTLLSNSARASDPGPEHTVVGVVRNIRQHAGARENEPVAYFVRSQRYRPNVQLVMSSHADRASLANQLRDTLHSMDPKVTLHTVRTSAENRELAFTFERMQSQAVSVFAVLGFLLSLLGIFGLLSYAVSRRVREMGIRMAVGARQQDLLRLVLGQGLRLGLIGVVIGLAVAVLSAPLLQSLLHGVGQGDPLLLVIVGAAVLLAALGAAYLPARRAARLDPLEALRHE